MKTVAGIFTSSADAERAVENLSAAGTPAEHISFLAPGTTQEELDAAVPTTETEQPGMGKAIGTAVGGALGVAGGLHLGAAAASLLVPGVGPILAAGIVGAAILGAGGAATGMYAGEALEDNIATGLPHDELFVYEDALRGGRSVVLVVADDEVSEGVARLRAPDGAAHSQEGRRQYACGHYGADSRHE